MVTAVFWHAKPDGPIKSGLSPETNKSPQIAKVSSTPEPEAIRSAKNPSPVKISTAEINIDEPAPVSPLSPLSGGPAPITAEVQGMGSNVGLGPMSSLAPVPMVEPDPEPVIKKPENGKNEMLAAISPAIATVTVGKPPAIDGAAVGAKKEVAVNVPTLNPGAAKVEIKTVPAVPAVNYASILAPVRFQQLNKEELHAISAVSTKQPLVLAEMQAKVVNPEPFVDISVAKLIVRPPSGGGWRSKLADSNSIQLVDPLALITAAKARESALGRRVQDWQSAVLQGRSDVLSNAPEEFEKMLGDSGLSSEQLVQLGRSLDIIEGAKSSRSCYRVAISKAGADSVKSLESIVDELAERKEDLALFRQLAGALMTLETKGSVQHTAVAVRLAQVLCEQSQTADDSLIAALNEGVKKVGPKDAEQLELQWVLGQALYLKGQFDASSASLLIAVEGGKDLYFTEAAYLLLFKSSIQSKQLNQAQEALKQWKTLFLNASKAGLASEMEMTLQKLRSGGANQ
jgi:hypothetical protein